MTDRDRVKLLFGPYRPLALRRGDQASCLLRNCDVVITGWSAGRISWPRCRALGTRGGGSGLLLDEELARAVRHESAAAVMHWWGVTSGVVWRWRKALGVGPTDSEGSRRLIQAASEMGAAEQRGRQLPPEQVERRRRTAREKNLAQYLQPGYNGPRLREEEDQLVRTLPPGEAAARTRRTMHAVYRRRHYLGLTGG
jgi:hypothetical protein